MVTQRQLPQQGDLTYTDDHWLISGMLQRYQTLQPINETPILDIYQRLPQVSATGVYADLPFNSDFKIIGQYDQFILPNSLTSKPQGPRFYLNPILATKLSNSYSYFKPSIEWSQSYYSVNKNITTNERDYNEGIPRYAIDSGLYFDKFVRIFQHDYAQTLEPRLYYLYVPYRNQTEVPVYDSAYMIFDIDQLTRNNRFLAYDRLLASYESRNRIFHIFAKQQMIIRSNAHLLIT
jgi:LPS-assembly protein